MAPIPEPRIEQLCQIYHPKKITQAALEIVDTPGLSRTHEGNAARLALIREAGCLVLVVAAFDGSDPAAATAVVRRRPPPGRHGDRRRPDQPRRGVAEEAARPGRNASRSFWNSAALKAVLAAMEAGKPLAPDDMTDEQLKVTRSFRLFSEKPRMVIVNTADDETNPEAVLGQECPPGSSPWRFPSGWSWNSRR